MAKFFRQGDVLILQLEDDTLLRGTTPIERENGAVVLAWGEVTGHSHQILAPDAEFVQTADGRRILITTVPVELVHEEHSTVALPAGKFEIIQQVEYSPKALRPVFD